MIQGYRERSDRCTKIPDWLLEQRNGKQQLTCREEKKKIKLTRREDVLEFQVPEGRVKKFSEQRQEKFRGGDEN